MRAARGLPITTSTGVPAPGMPPGPTVRSIDLPTELPTLSPVAAPAGASIPSAVPVTPRASRDPLGERCKALEHAWRSVIPARAWLVLRVDGRAFHAYTRDLAKPYDQDFNDDMDAVAHALVTEITHARLAYVQSDEISIIAGGSPSPRAEHWFGGNVQKVVSNAAALASVHLAARRTGGALPTFDGRAYALEHLSDVLEYLEWRQRDASRNAITMLAEHHLGRQALHRVPTRERAQRLADVGVALDAHPTGFRAGRLLVPETVTGELSYTHQRTGELVTVADVTRRVWVTRAAPTPLGTAASAWLASDTHPDDATPA